MEAAVRIEKVFVAFGQEVVLRQVSHEFERGRIHGIAGGNGSGKTVLMKCICGFLKPTGGRIFVNGLQVGRDMDFPSEMGVIIETPGFLPHLSGIKNLSILAELRGKISHKDLIWFLRLVGLDPAMKKNVGQYSLGMRQRLGIAQAIMEDPELLLLDEPFNGLDKKGAGEMRELLKELRQKGKTILLASHNPLDMEELCDSVSEMDGGVLTVVRP